MSTLSLRKIKHDSSAVDNIITNSDGGVGIGDIDPSTLPSFIHHAAKVMNGGGLGIQSSTSTDNRWIFFGSGTSSGDVQQAGILNQGSDGSIHLTTAGTSRLKVNANGLVTMPYQPAFSARQTSSGITTTTEAEQKFDVVNFNTGSYYNASTGRFTAPISGRYYFAFQMLSNSTNGRALCYLSKNNTSGLPSVEASSSAMYYNNISTFGLFDLTAGDYVSIKNASSSEALFYGSPSNQNWFIGYLVG